ALVAKDGGTGRHADAGVLQRLGELPAVTEHRAEDVAHLVADGAGDGLASLFVDARASLRPQQVANRPTDAADVATHESKQPTKGAARATHAIHHIDDALQFAGQQFGFFAIPLQGGLAVYDLGFKPEVFLPRRVNIGHTVRERFR